MVNYNRRMGNGVPSIMDYASPYINLAFALKDREKEEENRELQKEQLKLENEWKNKQMGFQENANKIAMDTYTLNREKFEREKEMNPDKPIDPILIQNLKAANDAKDKETGYAFLGAGYGDLISTLSEGAGKKPMSASFADALGTLSATKDKRLKELAQLKEIAVSKKDQKAIQAADAMISDINNGDEKTLSKLFPGQYYNYKAGLAEKNQARIDKLTKDNRLSISEQNAMRDQQMQEADWNYKRVIDNLKGEYGIKEDANGAITSRPLNKPERILAQKKAQKMDVDLYFREIEPEVIDNPGLFTGKTTTPKWVISAVAPSMTSGIGGQPSGMAPVQPQPVQRPAIAGGATQADLLPENGAAIDRVPAPPIEEDAKYIAGIIAKAAKGGEDPLSISDIKKLHDDFFRRNPGPEAQAAFSSALESQGIKGGDIKGAISTSGKVSDPIPEDPRISKREVLAIMTSRRLSRDSAIKYLQDKIKEKKRSGEEGAEIRKNLKKNIIEIGGNIRRGVRGILDEE